MKRFESGNWLILPYLLIIAVAMLRIEVINMNNLVPVFSCLLFFAATRPTREFIVPLSLLVGVDVFITTHRYGYPLTADAVVTWVWYLIAMLLGRACCGLPVHGGGPPDALCSRRSPSSW